MSNCCFWLDVLFDDQCSHAGKPYFADDDEQCRNAFGLKHEAHLQWIRDRSRVNREEYPLPSES